MSRHDIGVMAVILITLAVSIKLVEFAVDKYLDWREAKAMRVRNDRLRKYGMMPYERKAREKSW